MDGHFHMGAIILFHIFCAITGRKPTSIKQHTISMHIINSIKLNPLFIVLFLLIVSGQAFFFPALIPISLLLIPVLYHEVYV